jgi:hypothetical protein
MCRGGRSPACWVDDLRPERIWILAVKDERRLELWASNTAGERVRVTSWPVLAASGAEGPKLREGDHQVPEGIYQVEALNPNSAYYLSLKAGYPNSSDRAWACSNGRLRRCRFGDKRIYLLRAASLSDIEGFDAPLDSRADTSRLGLGF